MKPSFTKLYFIILLTLVSNNSSFGQSDNLCPTGSVPALQVNPCNGATTYSLASSYTVDNTANVSNNTACVSSVNNKRDGWYKFTATSATTNIFGTVSSNSKNIALAVYSGTCGFMVELGCANAGGNGANESLTFASTPGTTYYIRIIRYNSGSTNNSTDGTIIVNSPATNDNCNTAISLTPSAPGGACVPTCGTSFGATASSPSTGCSGTANDDVWYSFTASQISHTITVAGSTSYNAVVELLSGTCGSLTSIACADLTNSGGTETLTYGNLIGGNTYYIRVYDYASGVPSTVGFSICVTTPILPSCPGSLGGGVVNVSSLPYNSAGRTTTGAGNEITASNSVICGNSNYYQGPDEVFIFTPSITGNISITLTSGSSNVGIMLYNGCPFIGQGGSCVANSQSTSGNQFLCVNVLAGNTYYLVVDRNSTSSISSYAISISAPSVASPPGSTCANAVPVTLPFTVNNQSTLCKGDDYNNSTSGSCASLYESGEDMVYALTVPSGQCISVTLSNTSSSQAGFQVYENCPGSAGANCLGFVGGGNVTGNFSLPNAGTYYIIVDSWAPPTVLTYSLNITSVAGSITNDLPCNAISLPLNTNINGDNSCTGSALEPGAPSCWTTGALNTVWYTVVPTGTSLIIKTFLGTLSNTQIALYSGACNALVQAAPNSSSCNDNIVCGVNTIYNSQITVSGLTPGQTYFIRIDGANDRTGTFGIMAVDGAIGLPPVYGQDCTQPLPVCSNSISVANPGFTAFGNACDFGSSLNCLLSGERSGSWYIIPIGTNGNLEFDIIPNDWLGAPSTVSTDYDFAIWEIGMSGIQCSQLGSNAPVRCNYSALGVTGVSGTGNSPGAYPGYNTSYEPAITVTVGQVYLLFVSNYTNSTSGFTMNFTGAPDPINYAVPVSPLSWSGGTNSSWGVSSNWGSCAIPDCSVDAIVTNASINQPVVAFNQTVKNITINAGSTLTINSNVTLSVCGNFTNNGRLITLPGSTVKFVGSALQQVTGSLTGINAFANFTMQKISGTLLINNDIDIKENDSLKVGFFDPNNKNIQIGKNFFIQDGPTNHLSPMLAGKYSFYGNVNQTYTNLGTDYVTFFDIDMIQSTNNALNLGVGVFNDLRVGGVLTLTKGKIITNAKQVYVLNPANAAVTPGNTTSYVEGNLRRILNANALGVYDFPVGNAAKAYQRASVDFTAPTQIPELLAFFTSWGVVPSGPVSSECTFANYSLNPALNNGFWTFNSLSNNSTGTYDMTLYNTNYTNVASPGGWTVMKRIPVTSGPWVLDGSCVMTNTVTGTQRTGMIGFDADFATAQSNSPLPIELLSFDAKAKSEGVLTFWTTASETNNNYFTVERSYDANQFKSVGIVIGAGNSTIENRYSFLDKNPGNGIIYYRLKQTDYDGRFSYSEPVAVKINEKVFGLSIYPNPVQEKLNYLLETTGGDINLKVIDITGRVIYEDHLQLKAGLTNSSLEMKEIPDGVYYLLVTNQDSSTKAWFVKK